MGTLRGHWIHLYEVWGVNGECMGNKRGYSRSFMLGLGSVRGHYGGQRGSYLGGI